MICTIIIYFIVEYKIYFISNPFLMLCYQYLFILLYISTLITCTSASISYLSLIVSWHKQARWLIKATQCDSKYLYQSSIVHTLKELYNFFNHFCCELHKLCDVRKIIVFNNKLKKHGRTARTVIASSGNLPIIRGIIFQRNEFQCT